MPDVGSPEAVSRSVSNSNSPDYLIMKILLSLLFVALLVPAVSRAQSSEDGAAVRRAVLNYVEGFYEGDSTKIALGVYPDVNKRGFYIPGSSTTGEYVMEPMSYQEMFAYTRSVRESGRFASDSAPKEVVVFEVLDQTASARLTAYWGVDYLLLAKTDGEWKIWQVLWQTPPPAR